MLAVTRSAQGDGDAVLAANRLSDSSHGDQGCWRDTARQLDVVPVRVGLEETRGRPGRPAAASELLAAVPLRRSIQAESQRLGLILHVPEGVLPP
jgi:hypothetical protein